MKTSMLQEGEMTLDNPIINHSFNQNVFSKNFKDLYNKLKKKKAGKFQCLVINRLGLVQFVIQEILPKDFLRV